MEKLKAALAKIKAWTDKHPTWTYGLVGVVLGFVVGKAL